jgi:hypothetical protein
MKLFLAIVVMLMLYGEYNRPSCGTAATCGYPVHDFLHRVIG